MGTQFQLMGSWVPTIYFLLKVNYISSVILVNLCDFVAYYGVMQLKLGGLMENP